MKINKLTKASLLLLIALMLAGCSENSNSNVAYNEANKSTANINMSTPKPTPVPRPTPQPVPDFEAPKLYGVVKKQFYVGEGISYLSGVYAVDDIDTDVEITVNRDAVNTKAPGEYEVIYTATDDAGNSTSETTLITLVESTVTEDEVNALAQDVLDRIITEDMTQVEKMWEIYKYVNGSMTYDGHSNKDDWRAEAKRGFTNGAGDCFTYFSMSDILLEKIGVEKLKVNRINNPNANHYWHLVNVDGNWYHFDPCYRKRTWNAFLRTDAEVAEYASRISIPNYEFYTYDKSKYPTVATTEFEWDRDSYTEKK